MRCVARALATAACAAATLAAAATTTQATGVRQVNEAQAKAVQAVTLPDGDYRAVDEERATALGLALSAQINQPVMPAAPGTPLAVPELEPVLALGAPKRLQLSREPVLPALLATRRTGLRRWQVNPELNLRVVAVNLASGAVMSNRLLGSPKRAAPPKPSMSGPTPAPVNASSVAAGVMPLANLLTGLMPHGQPWPRGRYAFTLVELDWVSNTVVVDMSGGGTPAALPGARAAFPPLMTKIDEVPNAHEGVDFRVPDPATTGGRQQVQVVVSLPAAQAMLGEGDAPGRSMLLGSLLLVKLDAAQPLHARLAIPVATPPGDGRVRTGFVFDLKAALPSAVPAGTYQCYLVFGATVVGPRPLTVH